MAKGKGKVQAKEGPTSPTKAAVQAYPSALKKLEKEVKEKDYLPLPNYMTIGCIPQEQLDGRIDFERKTYPTDTPRNMKACLARDTTIGDNVMIPYIFTNKDSDDSETDHICYAAKCIYASSQQGYWAYQFYDNYHRTDEEKIAVFTDGEGENLYIVHSNNEDKQPEKKDDKTTQKQLIQQMKTAQETTNKSLKEEVQKIRELVQELKPIQQDPNQNEQMLQTLKKIEQQTKDQARQQQQQLPHPQTQAQLQHPNKQPQNGQWNVPLQLQPRNQQGYHPSESWISPHTQTYIQQNAHPNIYPTTMEVNTQAIIRGIPYKKDENLRTYIDRIIQGKGLDNWCVGMINPNAINPADYECKRALKDNIEPDPDKPPPLIIVTFKTRQNKLNFIRTKIRTEQKLTIGDFCKELLNEDNKENEFYISENLTATQRELFYKARQHKTAHNYKYAWTKHGSIYIKKTETSRAQRIETEEDLNILEREN